jgi:hypothetical protein
MDVCNLGKRPKEGAVMTQPLLHYIRQGSLFKKASVITGLAGCILGILLWTILIYFNPYSSNPANPGTFYITFFMLCLPAVVGLLSLAFNRLKLIWLVLLWTLPYGLYLTATPGIFNLYGLVLAFYFIAVILGFIARPIIPNDKRR